MGNAIVSRGKLRQRVHLSHPKGSVAKSEMELEFPSLRSCSTQPPSAHPPTAQMTWGYRRQNPVQQADVGSEP